MGLVPEPDFSLPSIVDTGTEDITGLLASDTLPEPQPIVTGGAAGGVSGAISSFSSGFDWSNILAGIDQQEGVPQYAETHLDTLQQLLSQFGNLYEALYHFGPGGTNCTENVPGAGTQLTGYCYVNQVLSNAGLTMQQALSIGPAEGASLPGSTAGTAGGTGGTGAASSPAGAVTNPSNCGLNPGCYFQALLNEILGDLKGWAIGFAIIVAAIIVFSYGWKELTGQAPVNINAIKQAGKTAAKAAPIAEVAA